MPALIPEPPNAPSHCLRLLVVDDNPANSGLIAEYFKPFNIQMDQVVSGMDALNRVKTASYDLIFMDVNMPGLNGPDTTALLRASMPRCTRIPVVALTAHAVEQQKIPLLEAGMDDYIGKPAAFNDLVNLLIKWLGEAVLASAGIQQEPPFAAPTTPAKPLNEATNGLAVVRIDESLRIARNNPALALDLMQQFLTSLPEAALAVNTAYEARQWAAIKDEVHRFYGGCCYVGVPALQAATQALNTALKPPYEAVAVVFQQWLGAVEALESWAQEHDLEALFDVA